MSDPVPQRVRVTGPPRHSRSSIAPSGPIDDDARLDEVYVTSLLHAQFWLAIRGLAWLVIGVASLPLVFHLAPGLAGIDVAGVPLTWLLLAVAVYPYLILLGWRFVRRAEQNEETFAELMAHRNRDGR